VAIVTSGTSLEVERRLRLNGCFPQPEASIVISEILLSIINGCFYLLDLSLSIASGNSKMKLKISVILAVLIAVAANPVFAKTEKNKHKTLPPGLQKKVDRGEPLPPGWQKKLVKGEIMTEPVLSHSEIVIPVDSKGLLTIRIEGKLVKLVQATREIIEVVDLLN
jgi:hypothetical protein